MVNIKKTLLEYYKKLKGIKNIEIIFGIVIILIVVIIYSSVSGLIKEKGSSDKMEVTVNEVETRLEDLLSSMSGVGDVKVMITYKSTSKKIIASTTNTHQNTTSNGSTTNKTETTTSSPVIINKNGISEPIVLSEEMPEVLGVVIIAKGATSYITKQELIKATRTLLNITNVNIEVFAMK